MTRDIRDKTRDIPRDISGQPMSPNSGHRDMPPLGGSPCPEMGGVVV